MLSTVILVWLLTSLFMAKHVYLPESFTGVTACQLKQATSSNTLASWYNSVYLPVSCLLSAQLAWAVVDDHCQALCGLSCSCFHQKCHHHLVCRVGFCFSSRCCLFPPGIGYSTGQLGARYYLTCRNTFSASPLSSWKAGIGSYLYSLWNAWILAHL